MKIVYQLTKHFPQASGVIIIILIILHTNNRRFDIKCFAQCHLTKEHQTNTAAFWTPEPHAVSLPAHHGSGNLSENVTLILFKNLLGT